MKFTRLLSALPVLFFAAFASAQTLSEPPKYGISFSGFLKTDYFLDTREGVSIREGHFLLFPRNISPDANGNDIYASPSFNFLSIQTRLTGRITAPDAFGAKVSGILEADFFGNENAAFIDANGFRLRHAYAKLNWEKTELIAGQFWHPLFIPACFSGVISFNTGAPFQPFSRNPQARLTYKTGKLSVTGVMSAQRDFASPGGSTPLRNSATPIVSGLISFETMNSSTGKGFLAGAGADYKTIQPFQTTTLLLQSFITDEKVKGLSATAYLKITMPEFTWKLQTIYGENLFDLIMMGGYVVSSLADPATNRVTYSTLNYHTTWSEIQTTGDKVQFALWAGYARNLGSKETILAYSNRIDGTEVTTRGADMKSVTRISPRIVFIQGKFNLATELEYTTVAYATRRTDGTLNRDDYGKITDSQNVGNLRVLLSAILNF
ncbi:MAG: hypothetical protein FJY11_02815 [Bacteroidetes bacterium]|nr:hypothetical protein [Bacteroidota bacterium]